LAPTCSHKNSKNLPSHLKERKTLNNLSLLLLITNNPLSKSEILPSNKLEVKRVLVNPPMLKSQ